MPPSRPFVPSLVAPLGGDVLVVDRAQPAAVLIGADGAVLSTVSWADVVPEPAETAVWPSRRLAVWGRTAWIEERSEGVAVSLDADGGGNLSAAPATTRPDGPVARTRFATDLELAVAQRRWSWTSERDGVSRRVRARCLDEGPELEIGAGTVVAGAVVGTTMFVAIRVAHQRPWRFTPPHRLVRLDAEGIADGARSVVDVPLPELTSPPWSGDGRPFPAQELVRHLDDTIAGCSLLRAAGADDVAFAVTDPGRRPVITTSFRMPSHPQTFLRHDELVDEVGRRTGGLAGLGVLLAEDLAADIVGQILAAARGPDL